jgi:hypothetical protein
MALMSTPARTTSGDSVRSVDSCVALVVEPLALESRQPQDPMTATTSAEIPAADSVLTETD